MGRIIKIVLLLSFCAGITWAAGIRFRGEVAAGLSFEKPEIFTLTTLDGKQYAGRLVEESEETVMLEIEQGVNVGFSRAQIEKLEEGGEKDSGLLPPPAKKKWFTYDEELNLFKKWTESINTSVDHFFGNYDTPEQRKAQAQRWAAGMRWQTGGREKFQATMDEAAKRSLQGMFSSRKK